MVKFWLKEIGIREVQNSKNKINFVEIISYKEPNKLFLFSNNLDSEEFSELVKKDKAKSK